MMYAERCSGREIYDCEFEKCHRYFVAQSIYRKEGVFGGVLNITKHGSYRFWELIARGSR
jgi:hypothetical protein